MAPLRLFPPLLTVAVLITSCAGPAYEYVRDFGVGVAYRVPTDWTVFDETTLTGVEPGSPEGSADAVLWLTAFDADPAPATDHVLALATDNPDGLAADYPYGLSVVVHLQGEIREDVDIVWMRNLMFPLDGFTNPGDIQVHDYNDNLALYDGKLRGVALDFSFRTSALSSAFDTMRREGLEPPSFLGGQELSTTPGTSQLLSDFARFRQVVLTDPGANRAFVMVAGCSVDCFRRNQRAIDAIVNSWTVIPQ